MTIARRNFLTGSAIGLAALAMPAVRTSAATRKITLGGYFDMADAIEKYWIEPFQQKFDVQVFYDPGNSINQVSKMLAERANPAHSVMLMDESFVPTAQKEGLIVPIDKSLLPVLAEVDPPLCGQRRLWRGHSHASGFARVQHQRQRADELGGDVGRRPAAASGDGFDPAQ
jgi:spermidine/putrescine-binding protein